MSYLAYLLGMAFFAWAVLPLFKKDSTWISLHMESEELEDRKQRVYGNIADLEFDYAMGRLSEEDFSEIRNSFVKEAGQVIKKLEEQKSSGLMDRIQKDLSGLGKHKHNGKTHENECQSCNTVNSSEAKFCMKCGEKLS